MRVSTAALLTMTAAAGCLATPAEASPATLAALDTAPAQAVSPSPISPAISTAIAEPETLAVQEFAAPTVVAQVYGTYQSAAPESGTSLSQNTPTTTVPTTAETSQTPANAFPRPEPAAEPAAAPAAAADGTDLALLTVSVEVVGAEGELASLVRDTVQTRPGGETSQEQIQADIQALRNTGLFRSVQASSRDTNEGLIVVFQVDPITVQSVRVEGATVLTDAIAAQQFQAQIGQTVDPALLRRGIQGVGRWYADNGYTLARVLAVRPSTSGVVTLEVAEGVVGEVRLRFVDEEGSPVDENGDPVEGRTDEEFIRREIQLQPGQVFRTKAAQEDLRRLYELGLFSDANVSLDGNASNVIVTYNVSETPSRAVNFGGGYDSNTGVYGTITYNDRNVSGTGQQLNTNVLIGTRDFQFDGRFSSPYRESNPDRPGYSVNAFRRRTVSSTFNDEVDLPNGDDPREGRYGGGVNLTKPIGDGWRGTLGLNYTRTSIRDSDGELAPFDELGNRLSFSENGIDDLTTVSLSASRDDRDNPRNPTSGSALTLSTEQSIPLGEGNILMNRVRADYSYYLPVTWLDSGDEDDREVLAFNLQGGTTLGDLPPYQAFNLGGTNSVRGYGSGDVGSGRSYILGSAEYRFPVFDPVGAVVFLDFASDLGSGDTVPGEPAEVRGKPGSGVGYGFGVRVKSPVGLIRADYGFNDDGEGRLHVGIGQKF